jgi:dipeptidyl aminopeptidase/acylaminoacyl peptidase
MFSKSNVTRFVAVSVLALGMGATRVHAQEASLSYLDKLPSVIDRELFFGDPEISGAQISPDGRFVTFRKPHQGVMNLWIKQTDEPFNAARPITADTVRPVRGYFWSQDSRYVLYVQDKGGNEDFHVYAVNPLAEPAADTDVPPARDLTPYDNVQARILAVPEATPNSIIVGLNDRDPQVHDVYRVNLRTGARELVFENTENIAGWQTDLEGNLRLAVRVAQDGGTRVLRVDGDSLVEAYQCSHEESCGPVRYHKDGKRVYMITNKGADTDLMRLVLFDPETGAEEFVESDPENQVDLAGVEFSDITEELVATYYVGDRLRIYPKTKEFARDLETLRRNLPEGEIYFGASTEDETLQLVSVTRDVDPGSMYLYDRKSGRVRLLYQSRPDLPSEALAPMRSVRYRARDGMDIPAYLTLPRDVEPRNLAVVIHPHGGPWARDTWGYDPYVQFLANRGYAVLQPNFRGSTGYGKAFLNAGNKEWGTGAMQHDISDGVRYLVDRGIADPRKVAIFGGSYGGYATLAGVAFTPDLYAAGVSLVGPSNLITLLNSIPPYWGPIKNIFNVRLGDPKDPADAERLRAQSPLFSAERITTPLLVAQGANDPRVNRRESDQIVVALRDLGREVAYLLVTDEGHGFAGRENRLAFAAATERFLAEQLGGRYQQGMPDQIAERLAALTVDVNTLTLAERPGAAEDAATAPLPEADGGRIRSGVTQYRSTLQTMGQEITLEVTRTVEVATADDRSAWRVIDQVNSPMGMGADTFEVDRVSLEPIRRSAGGTGSVSLRFTDSTVTGELQVRGQSMPIDARLDAPVFGNEAALTLVVAGLPLADGYETTLRVFDLQMQKARPMLLTVTDTDATESAVGSFDTFVVEIAPLDENQAGTSTMRVMRDAPHLLVRSTTRLGAAMGGGTATTELMAISAPASSSR